MRKKQFYIFLGAIIVAQFGVNYYFQAAKPDLTNQSKSTGHKLNDSQPQPKNLTNKFSENSYSYVADNDKDANNNILEENRTEHTSSNFDTRLDSDANRYAYHQANELVSLSINTGNWDEQNNHIMSELVHDLTDTQLIELHVRINEAISTGIIKSTTRMIF